MAACGTAFEIKKWADDDTKILLVDKAALERSALLLRVCLLSTPTSATINLKTTSASVRNDLMGIVREDLIFDLGRHVDDSVHLFEEWGLPIWKKTDDGKNLDGKKGRKPVPLKPVLPPFVLVNGRS